MRQTSPGLCEAPISLASVGAYLGSMPSTLNPTPATVVLLALPDFRGFMTLSLYLFQGGVSDMTRTM